MSSSYRTKRVSSVEACHGVSAKKKTYISVNDSKDDDMRDGFAFSQCANRNAELEEGTFEAPSSPAQHSSSDASTVTIKAKRVLPQLIKFKKCRSIGTGTDLTDASTESASWTDNGPGADSCFNFVPCVEKQARLVDSATTTVHSSSEEDKPMNCTESHSAGESVFIVQTKKRARVPLENWPCHVCGAPAPRQGLRIRIPFVPDPDPEYRSGSGSRALIEKI